MGFELLWFLGVLCGVPSPHPSMSQDLGSWKA
jgi:hypothetical protein